MDTFVQRLNKYQVNEMIDILFDSRFTDVVNSKPTDRHDVINYEDAICDGHGRIVWGKFYEDINALRVYVLDQYDNFKLQSIIFTDKKVILPHFDVVDQEELQDKYQTCMMGIFGKEYKKFLREDFTL